MVCPVPLAAPYVLHASVDPARYSTSMCMHTGRINEGHKTAVKLSNERTSMQCVADARHAWNINNGGMQITHKKPCFACDFPCER